MKAHLHIGVHFTKTQRLAQAVRINQRVYKRQNVVVPDVNEYRAQIDAVLRRLDGQVVPLEESRALLTRLASDESTTGLVMVDEKWCGPLESAFEEHMLYAGLADQVRRISNVFSAADLRVSMSIINPATLIGSVLDNGHAAGHANWFANNIPAPDVSWMPCIDRIQEAAPHVPLTIWTEEDAPLIWERILRHLGDLNDDVAVRGSLTAVRDMLSKEGGERLTAYAKKFTPASQAALERVSLAFLDKYEEVDTVGPVGGIPGWTHDDLAEITAGYDDDIAALSKRSGVTVLQPVHVADPLGPDQ
ncbi:hypothetical protein [Celeribacter marinus]|uniref:hypothetical protein n=1 Tax=Celeribacter marinus TaxID=1397108 RepID=UPI003F6CA6F3